MMVSLRQLASTALAADTVDQKLAAIDQLELAGADAVSQRLTFADAAGDRTAICPRGLPGKPPRVAPDQVPRRRPGTLPGRAALLHAIAHIEYSAIDLALDHALRFAGMPQDYYADWLRVACEEARHFRLLQDHLLTLGHDYGDFPVHDGLWEMAEKTADDVLARMAMVPRLLEARGLDATPPIQRKLAEVGDDAAVRILDVILHEEEDHVRLGDHWFRFLCAERNIDPEPVFRELIITYAAPWPQTPMNETARLAAGFTHAELHDLTARRPAR